MPQIYETDNHIRIHVGKWWRLFDSKTKTLFVKDPVDKRGL